MLGKESVRDVEAEGWVLFDRASHEPLAETPWSERDVRAAVASIVADAEDAFDEENLWPVHPLDEDAEHEPPLTSLDMGASGVLWALNELARVGAAELRRSWTAT